MAKFYCYCRVSTRAQDQISPDTQAERLIKDAEKLGMEYTVIKEVGSGESMLARPKFMQMLADLEENDVVGVWDQSRLSRSDEESFVIINRITEAKAKLMVNSKFLNFQDPQDRAIFGINSVFASFSRRLQAQKAHEGQEKVFNEGDWVFCSTLFGYNLVRVGKNKTVSIVEEEAKIIRFIYEKYAAGWSLKRLFNELQGIPLPRQNNFTLKKISRILQNPIYFGYYPDSTIDNSVLPKYTRTELESHLIHSNLYPAIVDENTWWFCFDKYRTVTPTHSRPWQLRWTKHSLSGIIRCPNCGKGISRFEHTHCYCTEDHSPNCPTKCRAKYDETWLETIMEFCFYLTFMTGNEVGTFFSQRQQELYEDKTEINKAIICLDKSLAEINTKIERIIELISDGLITKEEAQKRLNLLRNEQNDLEAKKQNLEQDLRSVEGDIDTLIELSVEEVIKSFSDNERDYFRKFIEKALLYKDCIEVAYMNGRTFTIPRPVRHNHIIEPVIISTGCKDEPFQFSFEYDFRNMTFKVKDVNAIEEAREWARKEWNGILEKARLVLIDGIVLI